MNGVARGWTPPPLKITNGAIPLAIWLAAIRTFSLPRGLSGDPGVSGPMPVTMIAVYR